MIYDYLIIGAGMGGLSAGLNLINNKQKVLILEKNSLPGGMVNTFKRGRFEFDTSMYDVYDYGDEESIGEFKKLLDKFDIDCDFKHKPINTLIKGEKEEFLVKGEFEDFVLELEDKEPNSIDSLKEFIALTKEIHEALKIYEKKVEVSEEEYSNFYKYMDTTAFEVLKGLKMPLKTINRLSYLWLNLGIPLTKINFIDYAEFMYKVIFKKNSVLNTKNLDFTLNLVKKYQSQGGKIYYNSEVVDVTKKDNLFFVKTKDNLEYKAKNIIGDIFKRYFFKDLHKEEIKEINKLENSRSLSPNGIIVFLGLNAKAENIGLKNYKYYHFDNLNSDTCVRYMSNLYHGTYEVVVPNLANENASPKNTTIIILKKLFVGDVFKSLTKTNYESLKEEIAKDLIEKFEHDFQIDIEEYIEEIAIATPLTILRYSGSVNGALFGYSRKGYDGSINRLISYDDEAIKGISFVGASSVFGSGVDNAFKSGVYVTNKLLKKEEEHE